jgi:hypothetical protein
MSYGTCLSCCGFGLHAARCWVALSGWVPGAGAVIIIPLWEDARLAGWMHIAVFFMFVYCFSWSQQGSLPFVWRFELAGVTLFELGNACGVGRLVWYGQVRSYFPFCSRVGLRRDWLASCDITLHRTARASCSIDFFVHFILGVLDAVASLVMLYSSLQTCWG